MSRRDVVTLKASNLYANGTVYEYSDGSREINRSDINYEPTNKDRFVTVKVDDTLNQIANRMYRGTVNNSNEYWYVLAIANRIDNPLDLSDFTGKEILVPDILNWKLKYE